MSLVQMNFESEYLNGGTQVWIILPDKIRSQTPEQFYRSGEKYPVLWLLHGTYGDNTDWVRRTNIELYASRRNLIVVMPTALNSNYSNWPDMMMGYSMYDFLIWELMPLVWGWFPASYRREDNFVAGLSMGGRGALKYALNFPEHFNAAAILSAAPVDFGALGHHTDTHFTDLDDPRLQKSIANAGGLDAYIHSEENTWELINQAAVDKRPLPRLFFACGEADPLVYKNFVNFRKHCREIGFPAEWFTLPGYRHEWAFWDLAIQKALDFFHLPNDAGNPY